MDDSTWSMVAQARAEDTAAIATLYERYSDGIYRYLLFVSGDSTLAEDLTGQAFLRLLDGSGRPAAPPTTVRAALYHGAHDLLLVHWPRRPRRSGGLPGPAEQAASGAGLEEHLDKPSGFWEQLEMALTRLSDLPIQVLALKIGGNLSTTEVAWILGCREDEIKQAQLQALVQLRQWLSWNPAAPPLEEQG